MANVSEWSTSAGSNNDAPPDGAPEGMLPGKVNDVIRENMAALAKWYKDQNASLTTAGTTLAYTLATNASYAALSDIPLLVFRLNAANTGACTLNVDGLGAKPLRKTGSLSDYASGELTSGQTMVVAYNSGTDDFEVIGPMARSEFASGTPMIFGQTAAPTGWTKSVTHDNKALRLVTGTASSGGTTAFTSVLASRTLAQANLPNVNFTHSLTGAAHTHGFGGTTSSNGAHNHDYTDSSDNNAQASSGTARNVGTQSSSTSSDGAHTHTYGGTTDPSSTIAVTGTVASGGSGTAMDFAVQYVDVIMATKD